MKKIVAFLISVLTIMFTLLFIIASSLACLTEKQVEAINNISSLTNTSNQTLISIFTMLCERDENVSSKINYSSYYNITEIDSFLNNIYNKTIIDNKIENLEKQDAKLQYNISQVERRVSNEISHNFSSELNKSKQYLVDIFDEKVSSLRQNYVTEKWAKDFWNNKSSATISWVKAYVYEQTDIYNRLGLYVFISAIILILGISFVVRFKPIKSTPILKTLKFKHHTTEDIITPTELKEKRERIRKLKLYLIRKKLKLEHKLALAKKIDEGEINNEQEIDEEAQILVGLSK